MTANELHRQIAEFVAERSSDGTQRARSRASSASDDSGALFTRDLMARLAMARGGPGEAGTAPSDRTLANGNPTASDETRRHAPTAAPEPARGIARFASDLVSTGGIIISLVVLAFAAFMLMRESPTAEAGFEVRAADEAAPVDVKASQPQNLFNEAKRTFSLVASGQLGVQIQGETVRDVEKYFTDNGVGYSVRFPITSMPLTGGIVSRYGGRAFAQLVYSSGTNAVYVIEVPTAELRSGQRLYVTPDVLARLEKGEKIQEMTPEGESLIMMSDGDLVIAAVGNMEPEQLSRMIRG